MRAFVRACAFAFGVRRGDMDSGHPSLLNRDDTKQFEAVWKRLAAVRAPLESVV